MLPDASAFGSLILKQHLDSSADLGMTERFAFMNRSHSRLVLVDLSAVDLKKVPSPRWGGSGRGAGVSKTSAPLPGPPLDGKGATHAELCQ